MAENLNYEPVSGNSWCYDNNDSLRDIYGALYRWPAAMNGGASSDANPSGVQGVCPDGWHLPSDAEWKQLEIYLGMSQSQADISGDWRGTDEGGKIKETGTTHWNSPNIGATNESGFSALPGGYRNNSGPFGNIGYSAELWSSTENYSNNAWTRTLINGLGKILRVSYSKEQGFSVRCLKD